MSLAAEKADLALLIAFASAAFTLGVLVWEIVRHWLEGARVVICFVPGIVTETETLLRRTPGTHSKPGAGIFDQVADRPWIEIAVITVTNYG